MNKYESSSVALRGVRGTPEWRPLDEKVGVRSIRIVALDLHASAALGTFFAADRMLLGWSNEAKRELECDFEIVYDDGRTISGEYNFRRKGGARPALMQYIRTAVEAVCEDRHAHCAVRGLSGRPYDFLERYETADFASQ